MSENLVNALDGNTFVVSDRRGDIVASPTDTTGLFSFDTRFLSKWVLTVDGQRLNSLSVNDLQYFETRFFLSARDRHHLCERHPVGVTAASRWQRLPRGADDSQPRRETGRPPRSYRRGQRFRRYLRDQGRHREEGQVLPSLEKQKLVLGYERETFRRETTISSSAPAQLDEDGLSSLTEDRPAQQLDDGYRCGHRACRPSRAARQAQVRAGSTDGAAEHGAEPGEVAGRCAFAGV